MESLTIGKVAKKAGVRVETVRFYEKEGLIAAPPRSPSGYRHYPPSTVRRIRFIRRTKGLGFTLREIGELLQLRTEPGCTCSEVQERARAKILDIETKLRDLRQMRRALRNLVTDCHGTGLTADCPILEELERKNDDEA